MELSVFLSKIYEIHGVKVILDFDLALLYEVETKVLNQAVKRNSIRFPSDFMFQLTLQEFESNWSQIVTSSTKHRGKSYLPYAFTEQGVAMLSSVLRSQKAALVNIAIMRAFVEIRKTIAFQSTLSQQIMDLKNDLDQRLGEHDVQLMEIYTVMEQFLDEKAERKNWENRKKLGYK
jgi:phage regulator Rha-like protein